MRTLRVCLAAASAAALVGCQVEYTEPTARPQPLSDAERDFEAVWQAARQTLGEYHFELDRQDRRAGVLTTLPMTGMHFFELWRKDAARPADFGESTIQTLYRTAQVTVRPVRAGAKTYQAQVEVLLRRSNEPLSQITSTSQAYSLFTARGRRRKRRESLLEADWSRLRTEHITNLGNDRSLEAKLTADISAAADKLRGVKPAGKPGEKGAGE